MFIRSVDIRQLKLDPGAVLAAARDCEMVIVMNRDQAQALLIDLGRVGVPELPAVRVALAVALFRSGVVSAGFAARVADKALPDMLTLLSSQGIPLTGDGHDNAEQVVEEMVSARRWMRNTTG